MAAVRDDDVGGDGRDDNESVSRGGTPAPLSDGSGATPGGGVAGGGASEASERAGTSGTRDETTGEAAGGEASETSERAGASGARDETTVDGGDDGDEGRRPRRPSKQRGRTGDARRRRAANDR